MNADAFMARGVNDSGVINLAIGEPVVLQRAMSPFYPTMALFHADDEHYQSPQGIDDLRLLLRAFLPHQPKTEPFIVVTNGAKQALAAAMYAMRKVRGVKLASARAPYWPSFATLAEQNGLTWSHWPSPGDNSEVSIVTWPNNPTGCEPGFGPRKLPDHPHVIWDAAYASYVYRWDYEAPRHDIGIGSLAKSFGVSGARIGWLWTDDEELARAASMYVEMTTSGVSAMAQRFTQFLLHRVAAYECEVDNAMSEVRDTLRTNGQLFLGGLGSFLDPEVRPLGTFNTGGMFGWFKVKEPEAFEAAMKRAKVTMLPGWTMGVQDSGYWRINLGASTKEIDRGVRAMMKELGA